MNSINPKTKLFIISGILLLLLYIFSVFLDFPEMLFPDMDFDPSVLAGLLFIIIEMIFGWSGPVGLLLLIYGLLLSGVKPSVIFFLLCGIITIPLYYAVILFHGGSVIIPISWGVIGLIVFVLNLIAKKTINNRKNKY